MSSHSSASVHLQFAELCSLIPHRYPFLLLDRVVTLEPGRAGTAIKNVTGNDTQLVGHFPGESIMPGVLIVEACAQLAAVVMASEAVQSEQPEALSPDDAMLERIGRGAMGYLASINRFKFFRPSRPGDTLLLKTRIGKRFQNLCHVSGDVSCARHTVAAGEIAISLPAR